MKEDNSKVLRSNIVFVTQMGYFKTKTKKNIFFYFRFILVGYLPLQTSERRSTNLGTPSI